MGQQVSGGLCYEMVVAALAAAQAQPLAIKDGISIWGEFIYKREIVDGHLREYPDPEAKRKIVPGDIVQYNNDTFDWWTPDGYHG